MIGDHHRVAANKVTMSNAADRLLRRMFLFWIFFVLVRLLSEALLVISRWNDYIIPLWSTRWSEGNWRMHIEKRPCMRAARLRVRAPSATED